MFSVSSGRYNNLTQCELNVSIPYNLTRDEHQMDAARLNIIIGYILTLCFGLLISGLVLTGLAFPEYIVRLFG